jgi:NAD(P)-dependent dehydrogenase (short-subunit alcohol dehydrogenase family)
MTMDSGTSTGRTMNRFSGKVVFITGAASGIGAATAKRVAQEGARVVVADRDAELGAQVAADLPDGFLITLDVTDSEAVRRAFDAAVDRYGRVDVVVNNAGVARPPEPLHETQEQSWQAVRSVNGDGAFYVLKYGIAALLRTGGGAVVNTTSTAALRARVEMAAYTFTKAGLAGLTRAAAVEYAARGIRVNAVAPTGVLTGITRGLIAAAPDPQARDEWMKTTNAIPGRPDPEDIAAVIAFLASDDARWVTGHVIPVDGGQIAR